MKLRTYIKLLPQDTGNMETIRYIALGLCIKFGHLKDEANHQLISELPYYSLLKPVLKEYFGKSQKECEYMYSYSEEEYARCIIADIEARWFPPVPKKKKSRKKPKAVGNIGYHVPYAPYDLTPSRNTVAVINSDGTISASSRYARYKEEWG
jgi:hypothetical protein